MLGLKNWKQLLTLVGAILIAALMIPVVTMPTALIMAQKGAAGNPTTIVSLVVVLASAVAIFAATMTSIRARPDDAPRGVIARMRQLFAVASAGLGGAVVFAFGILVGLLNAGFTADGNGEFVMFWLTAGLLGVGATVLLLALGGVLFFHFANAVALLFETPAPIPPTNPPSNTADVSRELNKGAPPIPPVADVHTPTPEPVPRSTEAND